jgi:hypothetical protein
VRIRKKTPKPAPAKPPLYVVGYSFSAPSSDELKIWYDLEYGGPLTLQAGNRPGVLSASHGPWHAWLTISLSAEETVALTQSAAWDHRSAGTVSPATATPTSVADTVLFAARLARGLTLLTQGTALDLVTQRYSNPSDWGDRPLGLFRITDHLEVTQGDAEADDSHDWFHTLGMSKFGLDELEARQPKGLPGSFPLQVLAEAAEVVLQQGRNPTVGSVIPIPSLGRTLTVQSHRTATVQNVHRILRRLAVE